MSVDRLRDNALAASNSLVSATHEDAPHSDAALGADALGFAPGRRREPQGDGLRLMLDAVPVEVMNFDANGRLLELNSAVQSGNPWIDVSAWVGKTFEEIVAESVAHFRQFDPCRDWDAWVAGRLEQFHSCGTTDVRRANGDWRRVHFLPTEGGGRLLLRLDITELKLREEMLAASERRYAELVDSLPDVVVSLGADGRVTYASNVAIDVLGRAPETLLGESLLLLVSADDRPRLAAMLERVASGTPQTMVFPVSRKGEARHMQFTLKRRASGAPGEIEIGGVIRDVHEQQTMALKREAEMEQLQSVFQSTGAYFLMLDRDERIVMINQALRDLRGYGDVVGEAYRASNHAGLDRKTVAAWQAASGPQRLEPVEYESKTLDAAGNARLLKVTATPVQDKEGRLRYIVLIGIDDTERRQTEIRLFDASRLANLGEMASGIAHEINQPLAVIRLAADALREELESPEAQADPASFAAFMQQKLERIAAQTERASGIIRELRAVARKPTDVAKPFDLADAVRVGDDLLHEQLRAARILLELDLPEGAGPLVRGEESRLQQVLINMVLNARDAILDRPAAASAGPLGTIILRVRTDRAGRHAILTIEDDGPGLSDDVLPRLYQPFFTTKPAGKGTGLGLSISHDIIRRMGGDISAGNRPEGGARFVITLPVCSA